MIVPFFFKTGFWRGNSVGLWNIGAFMGAFLLCKVSGLNFEALPESLFQTLLFVIILYLLYLALPIVLLEFSLVKNVGLHYLKGDILPDIRRFIKERLSRYYSFSSIISLLPIILQAFLCFIVYSNLKPASFVLAQRSFDPELWELDNILFLGHNLPGWVSQHNWSLLTGFLTIVYCSHFFLLLFTLFFLATMKRDLNLSWHYATSLIAAHYLSLIGYLLFPSWGPCYFRPDFYTFLEGTEIAEIQKSLLWAQQAYLSDPQHFRIMLGNGVGAMPSLHVTMMFNHAYYFFRASSRLWIPMFIWAVLNFVSTLYFGWHYLSDGLVGILITVLSIAIASRLYRGKKPDIS
ncbi:MAG: phosphatase PAP2 family protein [bacterium]